MRKESRTREIKHPGIRVREDALGRRRYMVEVRRKGKRFTETYETLSEALAARDAAIRWMDGEGPPPAVVAPPRTVTALTVEDAARRFCRGIADGTILNDEEKPYKPAVIRNHESALRLHVLPRVGAMPVATFGRADVKALLRALSGEGSSVPRHVLNALRVVLRDCLEREEITVNPCAGVRPPFEPKARRARVLTAEETERVIALAEADDLGSPWRSARSFAGPLVVLALGTGIRQGEELGVEWGSDGLDLNADPPVVWVNYGVDQKRTPTGYQRIEPKTPSSRRPVVLPPSVAQRMRKHRLALGRPADGTLVFPGEDGGPMSAHGLPRAAWRRILKAAKLDGDQPTWHDLRHTYASHVLAETHSREVVAELLGHGGTDLVSTRYGHAMRDDIAGAGLALDAYRKAARS